MIQWILLYFVLKEIDTYVGQQLNKNIKKRQSYDTPAGNFYINYSENKYLCHSAGGKTSLINGRTLNTWVRWGWFEDNILSKFLSVTSEDGENPIITEFRSVERVLTSDGQETDSYDSTVIRNSEKLETVNINSYILPGQFFPIENRTIKDDKGEVLATLKGDADKLIQLYHLTKERENFKSFATESDTIETEVGTGEFEDIVVGTREKRIKGGATFWTKKDEVSTRL